MTGMKRLRFIIICFVMALCGVSASLAAPAPTWEEVSVPLPAVTQTMEPDGDMELAVHDGYIYIRSERAVTVKIFSILGQLISQETVKPGLHRIRLNSRGIFILRAGTTTRRITL